MSIQAVAWALEQTIDDPAAKLVLISLSNACDEGRCSCAPAISRLAKEASVSESGVRRKLQMLVKRGLLRVDTSFDVSSGRQKENRYVLVGLDGSLNSDALNVESHAR